MLSRDHESSIEHLRKQLQLTGEIPAARFSCLVPRYLHPQFGLCVLLLVPATVEMSYEEVIQATSSADVKFSANLYSKLANPSENMVMSSLSVSSVLAMLLAGAKGQTALQIEKSLHQKQEDVMAGFKGIMQALESLKQDSNITLRAANKIYPDASFQILPEYRKLLEQHFLASADNLDFKKNAEGSRKSINAWVADQTNKKITKILARGTINADTAMVLINAIYFKGDWKSKFRKEITMEADFHVDDATTVKVQMMYRKGNYAMLTLPELNNAVALRMPYRGESMDMIFVLPGVDDIMEALEKKLPSIDFSKITFNNETEVTVKIPRFRVGSNHDLTRKLQEMGMVNLFSLEANLSGISGVSNLYVSTVVQKAFIEVNEDGAEAAASTFGAVFTNTAVTEPEFICNRPFYFYIQERKSGIVLLSGKVVNPNQNFLYQSLF